MDTENIRAKKLDTVMKELLGSVIAYNLVAQFRRQAAELARVKPRRLSFTGTWLTFSTTFCTPHHRHSSSGEKHTHLRW